MTRNVLLALILVLAFVGIADSWYLAESAYTNTALTCNIAGALDGCNIVAQSPYSHLFGIPLGAYGFVFYCFIFVLAAVALVEPGLHARRGLYLFGIAGAIASALFIAIQALVIKALCVYCLGSAVIAFLVCYLAYRCYKTLPPAPAQSVVKPW